MLWLGVLWEQQEEHRLLGCSRTGAWGWGVEEILQGPEGMQQVWGSPFRAQGIRPHFWLPAPSAQFWGGRVRSQSHLWLAFGLFGVCLETVSTLNEKVFALFSVVGFNSDLEPPPPQQFLGSFIYLLQSCLPKTARASAMTLAPRTFPLQSRTLGDDPGYPSGQLWYMRGLDPSRC